MMESRFWNTVEIYDDDAVVFGVEEEDKTERFDGWKENRGKEKGRREEEVNLCV